MNCPCCAAPIPSHGVVCTYCGHRIDVDLKGSGKSIEDYDLNASQCPDCEIPLKSLFIKSSNVANSENLTVSRCDSCLGIFIEQNTLDNILEAKVRQPSEIDYRLLTNLANSNRSLVKAWKYRPCPVCRTLMNRKLHGKRSGVIVDSCRDHGLWLDAGELRQLMEWSRAGGEKLDKKHRSHENKKRFSQNRQQKTEGNKHDIQNKLNQSTGNLRQNQKPSSTTNLEDLIEIIVDLFEF